MIDAKTWLNETYKNNAEELICQICKKEMPFKKKDGTYYFEAVEILKDFVTFFHQNGFVITFGTEHNTPQIDPLKVSCRGGVPLDKELMEINYEGTAVIAAHQYLLSKGMVGYLDGRKAKIAEKEKFVELGKAVIAYFQKP